MYRNRSTRNSFGGGRFAAARIVSTVGSVFALIEVIYLVLQIAKADPANGGYRFVQRLADPLALFFPGLFTFSDHNLTIFVNYGLAAVFWLVVTGFLARLLAAASW